MPSKRQQRQGDTTEREDAAGAARAVRKGVRRLDLVLVLAATCVAGGLLALAAGLIEQTGLADRLLEWIDRPHGWLLWSEGEEDEDGSPSR